MSTPSTINDALHAFGSPARPVSSWGLSAYRCVVDYRSSLGINEYKAPINSVIDRWSTTSYPQDWERYRAKWLAIFRYRQIVLVAGFIGLLVGAVSL